MKMQQIWAMAAMVLGLLLPASVPALPYTYTFSTLPGGGALTGAPGELVGWGYGISNTDTSNWLVLTQLSSSSFSVGLPDAGYFDFPIIAPGASASALFDPLTLSGLFGVEIDALAAPGSLDSGWFTVSGEWWNGDPLAGGSLLQPAAALQASYTLAVSATALPVPDTLLLLLAGLLALGWQYRRQPVEKFHLGLY